MKNIRNFCIIAHIDHGKSTLADRLLEFTNTVSKRQLQNQVLDNMDLERERGITIKSHAIQMEYKYKEKDYILNLIDTPGHVDFSYEVSRSIAACEGALLIVDAAQGIEAQTISNLYLALEHNLKIIPVINKIDLPSAQPELISDEIMELLSCKKEDIICVSAKTGQGIDKILSAITERVPAPKIQKDSPLQAMIFDSVYNSFRGIEIYIKIISGEVKKGQKVKFMATNKEYLVEELGVLKLEKDPKNKLTAGQVGYIISGVKDVRDVKVGDTITTVENPANNPLKGFEEVKPMVFAGIYPVDTEDYEELKKSLEKLQLNDASLTYNSESSAALGFGFRCGFLGMLHMEIIQERLQREFNMTVINTVPNVSFIAHTTNKEILNINNPSDFPDISSIDYMEEPFIKSQIITKSEYIGVVMDLCIKRRGILINQVYLTTERVELIFELPLSEIVFDFYDNLKTVSRGYASFDYQPIDYRKSDLVKLEILLNGDQVDALSTLIHKENAYSFGKKICVKLKELIPRQQYDIAIQTAIGSKIIARETVKALRKDVTAKCYGGDITRKRKLLEKQKKGKKRMRQVGNVEIPQSAFLAVLKLDK